ncbi:MAG: hypothetical protein QOG03_1128, partial [Actinomycetota bacterium]|nr:hypothetical protein [Actinomycetota bacterium]
MTSRTPSDLVVATADRGALGGAAALLGGEMVDNPVHVAALGADHDRRERALAALFGTALGEAGELPLTALRGNAQVGVLFLAPPGS